MSDRFRREIEEILSRMGDLPDRRPPKAARRAGPGGWFTGLLLRFWGPGWDVSPERLLLTAFVLAILAGLGTTMGLRLMHYVALFSVALFVTALILSMTGWHRPKGERRWRGQIIDYSQARARRGVDWRYLRWRLSRWFRGR